MRSETFTSGSLIGAGVSLDGIVGELDAGSGLDAAGAHSPTRDRVALDHILARRRGMLSVAAQVDPCLQYLRLAQRRAAELGAILVAMRRVDVAQAIPQDAVPTADQEDAAELHAVQLVVLDHNVARLHVDVRVIKDDAEVAER